MANNLEDKSKSFAIRQSLEDGKLDKYPEEEIVNWIFSEGEKYYSENKKMIKKQGYGLPYAGDRNNQVSFSGVFDYWAQKYSQENKGKIIGITKLLVDKINNNYEQLINEEYLEEVAGIVRNICNSELTEFPIQTELFRNDRINNIQGLKESLELLYTKVSKDKKDIFNNVVFSLSILDKKNKKKYMSQIIYDKDKWRKI